MVSKRFSTRAIAAGVAALVLGLAACASDGDSGDAASGDASGGSDSGDAIVVGFSQVGSESGWRAANTKSIKDTLTAEAGFDLKFSDAQQKQENQIAAIRSYIQQHVNVIAFSPVVESGWDAVLNEAKRAGIPVILTDRAVDTKDKSLYVTFLGSDFIREGRYVGQWVANTYKGATKPVNIVEIQGTTGSAPAIDRAAGFRSVIKSNPHLKIIASQTGDFTRAGGKQVMAGFLKSHKNINLLFAHNDDEGLGAIEAIKEAGLVPGKDIKIVTIDAVHDGMVALSQGKINFIAECSPLLGPQLMSLVKKVKAGQAVPKRIVTVETTFTPAQAKAALPKRKY
jgi:ABC-type sugar transport system substrate-binding protein